MTATQQELEDSLFEDLSFEEKSLRFATDAASQVVYITRERYLDVDEDGPFTSIFRVPSSLFHGRFTSPEDHVSAVPPSHTASLPIHTIHSRAHQVVTGSELARTSWRATSLRPSIVIHRSTAGSR